MSTKTVCLTPLRVKAGATLARAVQRADGKLLLPAGSELDADQLNHLNQRGIEFVYVEVDDERDEASIARDIATAEAHVNHLFRGETSEAREELKATMLAYRRARAA